MSPLLSAGGSSLMPSALSLHYSTPLLAFAGVAWRRGYIASPQLELNPTTWDVTAADCHRLPRPSSNRSSPRADCSGSTLSLLGTSMSLPDRVAIASFAPHEMVGRDTIFIRYSALCGVSWLT
jgi:hypothetical protein